MVAVRNRFHCHVRPPSHQVSDHRIGHVFPLPRQTHTGTLVPEQPQLDVPPQRRPGERIEVEAGLLRKARRSMPSARRSCTARVSRARSSGPSISD